MTPHTTDSRLPPQNPKLLVDVHVQTSFGDIVGLCNKDNKLSTGGTRRDLINPLFYVHMLESSDTASCHICVRIP